MPREYWIDSKSSVNISTIKTSVEIINSLLMCKYWAHSYTSV